MHSIAQCCNIIKRKLLSKLEVQRLNELDVAQSPILTDQSTKLSIKIVARLKTVT